ncbi:unnamed protein product, partial [Fusarium fujikuroi]
MATTQELFRVESASEWAKKNGITTWTKFHYGSQPDQSIFTPLDTWGHSLRQPYYGPIIESSQQYFLAVNWETEEEWDKFKLSPEHQQLMANLTTNNVQPETKIVIFTGNMFAIGFTSNVEIFTAYWPSSITHEAQTAIRKTEQLVDRAESGMPNTLCYTKKPMFGWIYGQKEWNGESAIASVWTHKWQNQELEQKYKTTEKRRVSDNDGRSYMLAVHVFQDDLKSLSAIGWESVHVAFERVRVVKEDALAHGEVSTAGTPTETGFQLSKTKLNPNEQSSVGSPDSETDSTRFTSTTLPSINSPEPSQLSTGSTVIKSGIPEPAVLTASTDASITGPDTSSDDTSRAEASSTIPAGLGTTRAENSEKTNPATETFVPEPSGLEGIANHLQLDLDSMFGTTTKRVTTTTGDASEPTETVWTGTCPAKNGPDPTVVDGEFTENIGEKCLCKWNTWMENDKTLQPCTVDQLRDTINDFCNGSRKLKKPTPTGLPDIAVNRFPTNGTHGIFISVGWATPPLWNSTDERCKANSDLLLADSCKAALERFECRGANTDELWGGTYYEALEEGGCVKWTLTPVHLSDGRSAGRRMSLAISADKNLLNWIDPNSGNTALHIAIESERVDAIQTLLDAGADPNLKNGDGLVPFAKAMRSNNLDTVRTLLDSSPDIIVDELDRAGVTPFLRACLDGQKAVPVIRQLLDTMKDKVNLNAVLPRDDQDNECGRTALIIATSLNPEKEGSDSLFNLLLEHGADPNVPCAKHGNTLLSKAADKGHIQAMEKLLEFNADPNIVSKQGHTPLSRAAINGHALAVRKLLESNADPNHQNQDGETALHCCSSEGHVSCIEELVTHGASINSLMYPDVGEPYVIGITPLVLAIACSQQSSVEKLLAFDPGPGQALHMALASEELPIAKAVFKRYPQPNLYDQDLGTPLHLAVMSNSEEIFDFILDQKGIDVNIPGPSGRTPLSYAAIRYQGFVKKLIQAQADPDIKDHEGKTPLDHVVAARDWEMAQILCPHTRLDLVQGSGRRYSVLYRACQTGHKDMFKVINTSCQKLNHFQYIELCELALHAAIAAGNEEFFNQLINVPGVTGTVDDDDGWTPLKYATVYNQTKIKNLLEAFQQEGMNEMVKTDMHDVGIGLIDGAKVPNGQRSLGRALTYCYESLGGSTYDDNTNSLKNDWRLSREYREGNTVGCGFDATKKCVYFTWEGERL